MNFKRLVILSVFLLIGLAVIFFKHKAENSMPALSLLGFYDQLAEHPSDIEFHGNSVWITELKKGRVLAYPAVKNWPVGAADPEPIVASPMIRSPHFIAGNESRLFVSEGWGKHIFEVLENAGLVPLVVGQEILDAPHGLCVTDNWLYIADSLNSRLLRIELDPIKSVTEAKAALRIEHFMDLQNRIAYVRQLQCDEDGIWAVNSYEKRPKLNSGKGSNLLLIEDFASGQSEVIASFPASNATGMARLNDHFVVLGLWQANKLLLIDLRAEPEQQKHQEIPLPTPYKGPPYGMRYIKEASVLYVTFIGDLYKPGNLGGIAKYAVN